MKKDWLRYMFTMRMVPSLFYQRIVKIIVEREREQIRQYMLKEGITVISLESNGNLLVQYKNGTSQSVPVNAPNLQQAKSYLQKNGKRSISLEELETSSSPNPKSPKGTDYLPWILGAVVLALVIVIVWLLARDKKNTDA